MDDAERRRRLGPDDPGRKSLAAMLLDRHVLLALVAALGLCAFVVMEKGVLGKPASVPATFAARPLEGLGVPGFEARDLRGHVSIVNFWASWCPPCQGEHPHLLALSRRGLAPIYGLPTGDTDAADYLRRHGNPYRAIGLDTGAGLFRRFGLRGIPQTVVLDRNGAVVAVLTGGLDPERIERDLLPAIARGEAVPADQPLPNSPAGS